MYPPPTLLLEISVTDIQIYTLINVFKISQSLLIMKLYDPDWGKSLRWIFLSTASLNMKFVTQNHQRSDEFSHVEKVYKIICEYYYNVRCDFLGSFNKGETKSTNIKRVKKVYEKL